MVLSSNNRLLYSVMYNMERYFTNLYCIENLYWMRRRVQYRFSIQYGRVQYISILYITLYNDLFIIYSCRQYLIVRKCIHMLTWNYFTYMNKMKNKTISHHQNSSKTNRKTKQYHTIRTVLKPIEKQTNITPSEQF